MFQTKVKIKQLLHAWYRNDFLLTFFLFIFFMRVRRSVSGMAHFPLFRGILDFPKM